MGRKTINGIEALKMITQHIDELSTREVAHLLSTLHGIEVVDYDDNQDLMTIEIDDE